MIFDPILFASTMYETANDTVLFCVEYLKKNGNAHVVPEFDNIGPVADERMAEFARGVLLRAQPHVRGSTAQEYVRIALSTLDRALAGERAPRSAA